MKPNNKVQVSLNAFNFYRVIVAIVFWLAFLFESKELLLVNFILMLLSALFKIRSSPLVYLWSHTVDRILPSKMIEVEENGTQFAHALGAILSLLAFLLIHFKVTDKGWYFVFFLAVFKSFSAFGYCGGLKIYTLVQKLQTKSYK